MNFARSHRVLDNFAALLCPAQAILLFLGALILSLILKFYFAIRPFEQRLTPTLLSSQRSAENWFNSITYITPFFLSILCLSPPLLPLILPLPFCPPSPTFPPPNSSTFLRLKVTSPDKRLTMINYTPPRLASLVEEEAFRERRKNSGRRNLRPSRYEEEK
ncbi:hypothetical protein M8J76_011317 [Diaphorina citri]|nr:hypothetical protein M8J76_011317 [Diaphorina citri]